MSIPLERLYHFVESIAREIRDDVVIYHFIPHGSKNINDLTAMLDHSDFDVVKVDTSVQIFCYDQEPLMFDAYQNIPPILAESSPVALVNGFASLPIPSLNLRSALNGWNNIYDRAVLLHSEQRSPEVTKYQDHQFVPVYYWSHALIARDWFRYANFQSRQHGQRSKQTFLIYNRAWSGTREYRLKFMDLLIDNKLNYLCQTTCNSVEPELAVHYNDYQFSKEAFRPKHCLEQYFTSNVHSSSASADFDLGDYTNCDFEVVLETLFDDPRLHLTEKTLRPIACGKPFLLCATSGSLEYLRSYGFRTFGDVIDESYDTIQDPVLRLQAVIDAMKAIAQWSDQERTQNLKLLQQTADFNRQHFFSQTFFDQVLSELKHNLKDAIQTIEATNTSQRYIEFRKLRASNETLRKVMTGNSEYSNFQRRKEDIVSILKQARKYHHRYHNK